ncbi:MAG: hypothetical protein ACMXX7_00890 [Candidatus Woesearchaeota archaeon]
MVKKTKKAFESRSLLEIKDLDPLSIESDFASKIASLDLDDEALILPEEALDYKAHSTSSYKNKNPRLLVLNQPKRVSDSINNPIMPSDSQTRALSNLVQDKRPESDIFYQGFLFKAFSPEKFHAVRFSSIAKGLLNFIVSEHYKEVFNNWGIIAKPKVLTQNFRDFGNASYVQSNVFVPSKIKGGSRYELILNTPLLDDKFQNYFGWNYFSSFRKAPLDYHFSNHKSSHLNVVSDQEIAAFIKVSKELATNNEFLEGSSLEGITSKAALKNSPFPFISKQAFDYFTKLNNNVLIKDGKDLVKPREFEIDVLMSRYAKLVGSKGFFWDAKRDGKVTIYIPNSYKK